MTAPRNYVLAFLALLLLVSVPLAFGTPDAPPDSAQVKALFRSPPREYSTGPLWVWNDMLTETQIRESLRDLAGQKIKQVWVHPRPGLMTPYLSDDWFRLWKVALKEAERLDMNVWIYDENSYPSGFAGGWVPELMPESRGRGLALREAKGAPKWSEELVGVYRLEGETFEHVTGKVKAGEALPEGSYLVAAEVRSGNSPWHGDRCYVNLLSPGVTEKFLEVTMEPYRREIGEHFGKRVPGVFTDEPNIRPAGGLPWSEILVQEFQKRWGYNLLDHLPSLTKPVGDWRKVRHNYYQVLHEQFVERWAKPNYNYCETNGLAWTGHYWDHDWPDCGGVPDNMAMYAWHQWPAIDCLMNQYAEHTHAQFGNVRMCRELLSVANQLGLKRTLCEIYGAGGWDLRFEDMKRIGDWLEVLGVNTLNQHLTYITLRGARKRDHPQSFSYHEPWWDAYHLSAEYFARLSAALSQGEQINKVLVLQPTTTAWMYQGDGARLGQLGESFFNLLMVLEAAQVEYDLGDEDIIARHGAPGDKTIVVAGKERPAGLRIGQREYDTLIFPPLMENLNRETKALLDKVSFRRVLPMAGWGPASAPPRVDGALDPSRKDAESWPQFPRAALAERVEAFVCDEREQQKRDGFRIERTPGDRGILFHHRRHLGDGQILFLVNTSIEHPSSGVVLSSLRGAESWNLYTGETKPFPFARFDKGISVKFDLPPSGSLLLFLSDKPIEAEFPHESVATINSAGPVKITRVEPNVLTLDYVDITAGGETKRDLYCYQANQFAWKRNGMERNPWDSAVQFKDELIRKTFPAGSGFTASYKFSLEGAVPKNLAIVIERPDLYTITCNGRRVKAKRNDWWLDKDFGRIPIAALARPGENIVTLKASPFTMFHELEPAYVLGDFALQAGARGFTIVPDRPFALGGSKQPVTHGLNPDGTMWLSSGMGFGGKDDRAPFVIFDLGRQVDLSALQVWNYNENHVRDLTSRGVSQLRITGAAKNAPDAYNVALGTFPLARAHGGDLLPELLPVEARGVRYVRFDILANHNGVTYPVEGEPADNGFVGLAEVQFLGGANRPIDGVRVLRASSQLASHQRLSDSLVNGSGLTSNRAGWNLQGHPFYAAGVSYRERFDVGKAEGRYTVALSNWHGSVARVTVNGKPAGFVDAPPWECDVTQWVKSGANDVEVTVIGTLKNTLGPHHGAPPLGAAWPGSFHHGPNPGPPPGARYSTVAYGLFEPFVLRQFLRETAGSASAGTPASRVAQSR